MVYVNTLQRLIKYLDFEGKGFAANVTEATQFCVTVGSDRGSYKKKQQNFLFKKNAVYFLLPPTPLFHRPCSETSPKGVSDQRPRWGFYRI